MPKNKNLASMLQPEPINGDRLLTVQETAEVLGLAVSTLNRGRVYGTSDLPGFVRIGKSIRYKLSTVQAYLASRQEFNHTTQADAA